MKVQHAAPGRLLAIAKSLEKHDVIAGAIETQTLNKSKPWRLSIYTCPIKPAPVLACL